MTLIKNLQARPHCGVAPQEVRRLPVRLLLSDYLGSNAVTIKWPRRRAVPFIKVLFQHGMRAIRKVSAFNYMNTERDPVGNSVVKLSLYSGSGSRRAGTIPERSQRR